MLMGELLAWINRELAADNLPVPVVAALSHYQYATIHPFVDGNGRTARLITTLILRRSGYGLKGIYSLDEHYATHLAGYYNALGVGHHNYYEGRVEGDVTPLLAYFCNGMAEAFASVRAAAARSASHAEPDRAETLRRLDPRLRRLLPLFEAHGAVTSAEMAHVLFMAPGTLVRLCRQWVTDGVLEVQDLSRKNRSYRLGRTLRGPEFDWKIRS